MKFIEIEGRAFRKDSVVYLTDVYQYPRIFFADSKEPDKKQWAFSIFVLGGGELVFTFDTETEAVVKRKNLMSLLESD